LEKEEYNLKSRKERKSFFERRRGREWFFKRGRRRIVQDFLNGQIDDVEKGEV